MSDMKKCALLEAINLALHRAMAEDDDVVVLGEDIGVNGGVFRATQGCASASASSAYSTRRWPRP